MVNRNGLSVRLASIVAVFMLVFSSSVFTQVVEKQSWGDFKPYQSPDEQQEQNWQWSLENARAIGDLSPTRFLSVDRFADKYPSLTPYHYAANNPIIFVDVNGDTIVISQAMANSEALQNFANTKEGYKYLSQFAYEGQTIINGQEFTFGKAGDFGNQNLKFMGFTDKETGLTVPVTNVGGLELRNYVGTSGTQSYEVFIGSNMSLGNQMDAVFHEVQHASMFASGQFRGHTGRTMQVDRGIPPTIEAFHHAAMMNGSLWASHQRFINQANIQFKTNITVYDARTRSLWNGLPNILKDAILNNQRIRY